MSEFVKGRSVDVLSWNLGHGMRALTFIVLTACTGPLEDKTLPQRLSEAPSGVCEVKPPFTPNFEPELEWEWTGSSVLPDYNHVIMTPIVVRVDGDGVSDIVFNTSKHTGLGFIGESGVMRAIRGNDGQDLWTVTAPEFQVRAGAQVAAGDIDGDGHVELCTVPANGQGIICFEHDGTFKFRSPGATNVWGGPSMADLDGDGLVEILNGNHVYSNTGILKWVGADGMAGIPAFGGVGPISFAADIDGDGKQEVINDRAVYRADGTLKCVNTQIGHGLAGVGNFDSDARGEIVVVWSGRVSLLDDDCTLVWTTILPGGGNGGAPNIADFDNDGQPEIGVAGASRYAVFEANGTIKWSSQTRDNSSNVTGSSTFDFEGDGKAEVVYADEIQLRIYDGATGTVRFQVPHSSCTAYENPVVVDVDGDNNAEIVVAENSLCSSIGVGPYKGIRVFRDKHDGWVNTRPIWNQHAYSVTNVNEDGTLPAHPATNWLTEGLNTFRSNSQGMGTTSPFAASDLQVVSPLESTCDHDTLAVTLKARVRNAGDAAASGGLKVAFYRGAPSSGGTLLGVATVPAVIPAGSEVTAELTLATAPGGTAELWAVADDDGTGIGHETECREDNNAGSTMLDLACTPANLPPVAHCRNITISAGATCQGSASVNNGSYDPDNQPSLLVISEEPNTSFGLGSYPIVLTASDGAASAQCTGTVTVVDNTKPSVSCPTEPVVVDTCTTGGSTATFSVSANDNCGPVPVTCSPGSGSPFPLGDTNVTCSAKDASGNEASCAFTLRVTGPAPNVPPTPGADKGLELWPPNHKYVTVALSDCATAATDACGSPLPLDQYGHILRVTSDEVEDANGNGDGRTCDDMALVVGASSVKLRAEREGTGDGRIYTLHYAVTNKAGISSQSSCRVYVPHDQSDHGAVDSGVKFCVGEGCPAGTTENSALCR
jgi:hypothetical protein